MLCMALTCIFDPSVKEKKEINICYLRAAWVFFLLGLSHSRHHPCLDNYTEFANFTSAKSSEKHLYCHWGV